MRLATRVASLLAVVALAGPARAERIQLAVMDLEARNVEPLLIDSVSESVVGALRELRVFKVISRAEIRQMLSLDKERALISSRCSESSCLAEVGSALGARYLVVGTVSGIDRTKGPFTVKLQLFDMKKAEVAAEQIRGDQKTARDAVAAGATLALEVVRPILDKEQGFFELVSRESAAKVSIDGRLVGLTPFPVQKLGWGPHRVVVEKEGFIAWAKDVQIERNQATTETVTLIPSPDFVSSYRSRNRAMRLGAYLTTALAVVGLGAAAGLQLGPVNSTYSKFEPLQRAFSSGSSRAAMSSACSDAASLLRASGDSARADQVAADPTGACYSYAKELSTQGSTYLLAARGSLAAGVVAGALAGYLWSAGDDPDRYQAFTGSGEVAPEPAGAPKASLVPAVGGAMATVSFSF